MFKRLQCWWLQYHRFQRTGNFNADLNKLRPGTSMPAISTPEVNSFVISMLELFNPLRLDAYLILNSLISCMFCYMNILIQRNEDIWNKKINVYMF